MTPFQILFVDDDREILAMAEEYLSARGFTVKTAEGGLAALDLIRQQPFDLVFTDFKMPQLDGVQLLKAIKNLRPTTEVVIITGYGSAESAVEAMKSGCIDYLQKPFRLERLQEIAHEVMARRGGSAPQRALPPSHCFGALLGLNAAMQTLFRDLASLAANRSHLLLLGESGTGKQLAARELHRHGGGQPISFRSVNCRALAHTGPPRDLGLAVSELLDGGAGGTLFLEEICAMPLPLQQALGRHLEIDPQAGGTRILAATKQDLALDPSLFRHFNGGVLTFPPLRERREDIALLLLHFLQRLRPAGHAAILGLSPETLDLLLRYDWPGNLIQLQSVIQRAYALKTEGMIAVDDLPAAIRTFGQLLAEVAC